MKKKNWLDLQLFAQGEEGGEEAAAAVQTEEAEQQVQQMQQEDPQQLLSRRFYSHIRELERQAEALKTSFPELDLHRELRDPMFSRLTSPSVGLSVEDAYYAVHRRELQEAAMQTATRQVTNAIASGGMRPQENGLSGQAPAVSSFDYRSASREQREALKRQIRQAAAEGKKLYPGR